MERPRRLFGIPDLIPLEDNNLNLPLFFHRPNGDDANFLNLATGMMSDPRPILTYDYIIGGPDQPVMLRTYRIEVLPALFAALSSYLGIEVIEVAHLVWAPFACLMIACAFYLFCRIFGGKNWMSAFVIALSIIVFVHEYGHYIVGRWSGIHPEIFSIGFGPVLWSRIDKRGTRWQVAALPFSGYVRFKGDGNAASAKDETAMAEAASDPEDLRRHGLSR